MKKSLNVCAKYHKHLWINPDNDNMRPIGTRDGQRIGLTIPFLKYVVAEGATDQEIADYIGVSRNTVGNYRRMVGVHQPRKENNSNNYKLWSESTELADQITYRYDEEGRLIKVCPPAYAHGVQPQSNFGIGMKQSRLL